MAGLRVGLLIAGLWLGDWVLGAVVPLWRYCADPLLLFLILLGLRLKSARFLWLFGAGLGLLRDLSSGGLFGAWACADAGVGWVLGEFRRTLELEDPLILGVWAGAATLLSGFLHGALLALIHPGVGWAGVGWAALLLRASVHGAVAFRYFPRWKTFPV